MPFSAHGKIKMDLKSATQTKNFVPAMKSGQFFSMCGKEAKKYVGASFCSQPLGLPIKFVTFSVNSLMLDACCVMVFSILSILSSYSLTCIMNKFIQFRKFYYLLHQSAILQKFMKEEEGLRKKFLEACKNTHYTPMTVTSNLS